MRDRLNSINKKISMELAQIEVDKENNKKIDGLTKKLNEYRNIENTAKTYHRGLMNILEVTEREDACYKERRINYLEESLQEKIDLIFPYETFEPKLEYQTVRGKNRVSLKLKDIEGFTRNPFVTEGKFFQELVGFTSSMSVIELLGTNLFLIDEAFSAASEENKIIVGDLLQSYIDKGIQMILISQDSSVYSNLNRREIELGKHLINGVSATISDIVVNDNGGEYSEIDLFGI